MYLSGWTRSAKNTNFKVDSGPETALRVEDVVNLANLSTGDLYID